MRGIKNYFLSIFLLILTGGCAVHSPMSEMLMFKQKKAMDGRLYSARYSHAIAGISHEFYQKQIVIDHAYKKYPLEEEYSYDYIRFPTVTTHAIFMSDKIDNFAFSLAFGNVLGGDVTIKLLHDTFITGAISRVKGLQGKIILQQRIFDGNPIGLSLGVTYGENLHEVSIDGIECGFCYASVNFSSKTAGLRFLLISSDTNFYGKALPYFYMTGSANYDFVLDTIYPQIGFTFGFY